MEGRIREVRIYFGVELGVSPVFESTAEELERGKDGEKHGGGLIQVDHDVLCGCPIPTLTTKWPTRSLATRIAPAAVVPSQPPLLLDRLSGAPSITWSRMGYEHRKED